MTRFGCALALILGLAAGGEARAAAPQARTDAGVLRGVSRDGLVTYKGVPFAAPPLGALRWRPPQPVRGWAGVRAATDFAPACMQTGVSMPGEAPPKTSEDCLYLNIWRPARRTAPLPVLVWIHGGGFTNGSASMPLYWGDQLARRGVMVVSVAYRLGPFGYLAHPELTRESGRRASGDYGVMDQIAALRWVKRNISAFGGDPSRVTVLGQSAGATSVSLLVASPQAHGLFQRAGAQSGGLFEPVNLAPDYLLENAEKTGQAYAASVGAGSLAELRALPAAALLGGRADTVSHPVIEGYVLPRTPYEAYVEGRQNDVPLLIGSNAEEARSLVDTSKTTAATYLDDIGRQWGPLPEALPNAYPHATDTEARQGRAHFERDLRFGWDMWAWARLHAARGRKPVYVYHFTQSPPFPAGSVYAGWGPSHYAELWYMFHHLDQARWAWTAQDRRLAEAMADYWTNFVKTGDPNGSDLPRWPSYGSGQQVLYLGDPIRLGGAPELNSLRVFDQVYDHVRGRGFGLSTESKAGRAIEARR